MTRRIGLVLLLDAALMLVAPAFLVGGQQDPPVTSWDCPKMLDIKKEWQAWDDYLRSDEFKTKHADSDFDDRHVERRRHDIVSGRLTREDLTTLALTCGALPEDEKEWSVLQWYIIQQIVETLVTEGDRPHLVDLLSTRCPSRHDHMYIEDYLVRVGTEKLNDPILVLGEAYSKCQAAHVRTVLASALRRGLKGFGIRGNDDAEFVEEVMKWYGREKDRLVLNPKYGEPEYDPKIRRPVPHWYMTHPLFQWKSPSDAEPAGMEPWRNATRQSTLAGPPQALREITNSIGMRMALYSGRRIRDGRA